MIALEFQEHPPSSDRLQKAGYSAERQLAFYLHRAFAESKQLLVLNGLRLEDNEQPEHDGRPGAAQIDHLIVHRFGAFIVESKSICEHVTVRSDGSGGDEWTRTYNRREQGVASPIQQARRQAEFLRSFLQRHRTRLLGKGTVGLRTIMKLREGTDQRGFRGCPIQIIVAISDKGRIERIDGWTEPTHPFKCFVTKADLVADKILQEYNEHHKRSGLLSAPKGDYGLWSMSQEEAEAVASFLAEKHCPLGKATPAKSPARVVRSKKTPSSSRHSAPAHSDRKTPSANPPACRGCSGRRLDPRSGKFGYYWKCADCDANTPMPTTCQACGAENPTRNDRVVTIHKKSDRYFQNCSACGIESCIWPVS